MTPEKTRDLVIDAVRRDLLGPLADTEGTYPGAAPIRLGRGQNIDRPRDLNRLFVADDGAEVLREPPTARYIVGALYPVLRSDEEHDLDDEQGPKQPNADDAGDDAAEVAPRPAKSASDAADDEEAVIEDLPRDRPGRPASFGFSFVVAEKTSTLELYVDGARYEPFPFSYKGTLSTGWHRVPVHAEVRVPLRGDGEQLRTWEPVVVGPLHLEVGVHARVAADGLRIVTCYLVNRTKTNNLELSERVLFGAKLTAAVPAAQLADYPDRDADMTPEAASLRLLYADAPIRAVGHGADAVVTIRNDIALVCTESLPVATITGTTPDIADSAGSLEVDMDALGRWDADAVEIVERMISSYREWISDLARDAAKLTGPARKTAETHEQNCRAFADDVAAGWALAASGPVHECLRWTSAAMAQQRRSYAAPTREVSVTNGAVTVAGTEPENVGSARWRPFQLAFLLANLAPVVDPAHVRRGVVDVIWMPTGGGKTEAYLALAAFTMLFRRRMEPTAGGTAVIMRYTLRLLTAQQLQRAASLLCALETLRAANPEVLGRERFSIGAWLGRASTPNWRKDALRGLRLLANRRRGATRPFLLSRCPACAAAFGDVADGQVLGYGVQSTPKGHRMQASCPNRACAFHLSRTSQGLPVYEVDEDIYSKPPTFLVATVDKFAQLAWNDRARVLFGLDGDGSRKRPAPELVIQDELHLISGPLGSLVGLYESAIDQLCRHDGGGRPHVVAATATTRAYARQAEALYACPAAQVRLVPPPGLTVDDSFFAQADTASPPRAFLGVCATGGGKFAHTQMRVLASLAHAASALEQQGAPVDPYWTNVVFFGSLRDLGQAKALISTDLRTYAWRLVRATGIRTGKPNSDGERKAIRTLTDAELTSASSSSASEALERLTRRRGQQGAIDLALATSVIEVGVDVDRLGLLTIVRQPKTAAQYIQVAGRVGRKPRNGPGLVVVLLNPLTSRDVSHYERFTSVHQRLYAAVEPASVTPFTDAALTRGLRGALASIVRQVRAAGNDRVLPDDIALTRAAAEDISRRAARLIGPEMRSRLDALSEAALNEVQTAVDEQLGWGVAGQRGVQFLRPLEDPAPIDTASWPIPTSLRSVDADAALRIDESWLPARISKAEESEPSSATQKTPTEASEEDTW
ncbi:helicase-related protein [Glycomyces sp. NPDC049804]|uniref:helicase-related protein n=1 Tax=Glycomyces sp. NPDC049804 TaxID=3154363 RepID=UPI003425EEC8